TDRSYFALKALEMYLRNAGDSASYLGFLTSNRSMIVKSPPLGSNWIGINGTWYRRYVIASKVLKLSQARLVAREAFFPSPSDNEG
ncbi:28092_t:CDS:2, partial [Racocetra persica]